MTHRKKNKPILKWQRRQTNNKTTQTKINKQRNENKLIMKMAAIQHSCLVTKLAGEGRKNLFIFTSPTVRKLVTLHQRVAHVTLHL